MLMTLREGTYVSGWLRISRVFAASLERDYLFRFTVQVKMRRGAQLRGEVLEAEASKGQRQLPLLRKGLLLKEKGLPSESATSLAAVLGARLALIYSSKTSECLSIVSAVRGLFGVASAVGIHALEC